MRNITKQIFKGHVTPIMSILIPFFLVLFKTTVFFFLLFSLLNFEFTIYFYILVLCSVFEKHKLGSSLMDQIGKTAEFLALVKHHALLVHVTF